MDKFYLFVCTTKNRQFFFDKEKQSIHISLRKLVDKENLTVLHTNNFFFVCNSRQHGEFILIYKKFVETPS